MQVDALLLLAEDYVDRTVTVDGLLCVIEQGDEFLVMISTHDDDAIRHDETFITIRHTLAEMRKLIQPMTQYLLIYRGMLLNPPYYYRFPVSLQATLRRSRALPAPIDDDPDGKPNVPPDSTPHYELVNITHLTCEASHAGNLGQLVADHRYEYQSNIIYQSQTILEAGQRIRATIESQRHIRLQSQPLTQTPLILEDEANRHVRTIQGQWVRLNGWLRYQNGTDGQPHFVFCTYALRASVIGVGILRNMTRVWWQPDPLYKLIRAHLPIPPDDEETLTRVTLTAQFDFLRDRTAPIQDDLPTPLTITKLHSITIYHTDHLHIPHQDTQEFGPV